MKNHAALCRRAPDAAECGQNVQPLDPRQRAALRRLTAGLAHRFNNLLCTIMGYGSLGQGLLPAAHPVSPMLQSIVHASEQGAAIVREMLAYCGAGETAAENVDASALVAETVSALSLPDFICLDLRLARDLPPVRAGRGQIKHLLVNLIRNAEEAIHSPGGIIRISTGSELLTQPQIDHRDREGFGITPGPYVSIEICDSGCGMDEEVRAQLFSPFFSTKFPGRGLGLAAAYGIVRCLGGGIFVESSPGHGSRFQVLLPAAEPSHRPPSTALPPTSSPTPASACS